MKTKTKIIVIIGVIVVLLVAAVVIYWESTHGNRSLIDTKYRFDRAIIQLPNGEIVIPVNLNIAHTAELFRCDLVDILVIPPERKLLLSAIANNRQLRRCILLAQQVVCRIFVTLSDNIIFVNLNDNIARLQARFRRSHTRCHLRQENAPLLRSFHLKTA